MVVRCMSRSCDRCFLPAFVTVPDVIVTGALSSSSTLASKDMPLALPLRTALFVLALHCRRAWLHQRTQCRHHCTWCRCRHRRPPAQIYQLPCRVGRPCLSLHCPALSLSSPSSRWHTRPHHALASLPTICWHHRPIRAGFCPIAMLLRTQRCCIAGAFLGTVLVSSPASRWHLAGVALATLPLRAGIPASIA